MHTRTILVPHVRYSLCAWLCSRLRRDCLRQRTLSTLTYLGFFNLYIGAFLYFTFGEGGGILGLSRMAHLLLYSTLMKELAIRFRMGRFHLRTGPISLGAVGRGSFYRFAVRYTSKFPACLLSSLMVTGATQEQIG